MSPQPGFDELMAATHDVAETVLLCSAASVDQATEIPRESLAALSALGLFGLAVPRRLGGLGLASPDGRRLMRVLGGACGATAFSFAQHLDVASAVARSENVDLRDRWLPWLCHDTLAGVAFAHIRREGAPAVVATRSAEGWLLNGEAPWATSWGNAGVFSIAAVTDTGELVWVLVAGTASDGMQPSEPLALMVFGATATVRLSFTDLEVPDVDVLHVESLDGWKATDRRRSVRPNPLCLGVGDRALTLLRDLGVEGADQLGAAWAETTAGAEVAARAGDEQSGDIETIAASRAETIVAVQRLTTVLLAAVSGQGMVLNHPAQRLAREALFYVVQAQSTDGKAATIEALLSSRRSSDGTGPS